MTTNTTQSDAVRTANIVPGSMGSQAAGGQGHTKQHGHSGQAAATAGNAGGLPHSAKGHTEEGHDDGAMLLQLDPHEGAGAPGVVHNHMTNYYIDSAGRHVFTIGGMVMVIALLPHSHAPRHGADGLADRLSDSGYPPCLGSATIGHIHTHTGVVDVKFSILQIVQGMVDYAESPASSRPVSDGGLELPHGKDNHGNHGHPEEAHDEEAHGQDGHTPHYPGHDAATVAPDHGENGHPAVAFPANHDEKGSHTTNAHG